MAKVRDVDGFAERIHAFRLTEWHVSQGLAASVPFLEMITGFALLARWIYGGALVAAAGMSAAFLVALGTAWARGLEVACGCFGPSPEKTNYPLHMLGGGALLAAVSWLLRAELSGRWGAATENSPRPSSDAVEPPLPRL